MKASVEPLEGNKVKLSVELDDQEFEKAVDAAFRKIAREVRIPGFRPGKAPRKLLEARVGLDAAREEAIRESLPGFYVQALRENDVDAIAAPEIDVTSGREDGPVAFDAVVEVRPQVAIPGYQGLRVTIPSPEATDDDVERQVDRLRAQAGELRAVEREARDGDFVTIDIKGERDGEAVQGLTADDYLYEVGSAQIATELDDNLRGAKVGEILGFDAPLPDDGTPQSDDTDPGKVSFRVLVKEVKERLLPDVNDEWASEASEFDTVEELRADLRHRIATVKKVQAQLALRDQVLRALVELVSDEIPETLIAAEVERRVHDLAHRLEAQGAGIAEYLAATGQTEESLISGLREAALEAVKADLALRALAEAESVEVTDQDVDDEVKRLAERTQLKVADIRRQLDRADQMPAVRSDIRKTKALEWLTDHVEIVDEEGRAIDRASLVPDLPQESEA